MLCYFLGGFEINLDKSKLKTPLGTLFKVPNEALALAVANEWQSQNEHIKRHTMHLVSEHIFFFFFFFFFFFISTFYI